MIVYDADSSQGLDGWSSSSGEEQKTQVDARSNLMLLRKFFFNLIRPLFVRNMAPNEDFNCTECGQPVLRRVLFCSRGCHNAHSARWVQRFRPYQ